MMTIESRTPHWQTARRSLIITVALALGVGASFPLDTAAAAKGWLSWRGPEQTGVSRETGLPDRLESKEDALWSVELPGMSTPVIADGRLYILGYLGEGPELQEVLSCFDAETGELLWRRGYNDFMSDIIYDRYSTSTPAIDPETGNVYMQGTQGILAAFTAEGVPVWDHSMMEKLGRMTFPNGRTASPLIDGDLLITRGITSNWGDQGPASDRLYAFDKKTGDLVWASTPAGRPRDNSFSHPYVGWHQGKRVLYTAAGDGSVVSVNARTGEPLWRVPLFKSGINATVLVHNDDKVISIFGVPYEPGQMVALRIPTELPDGPRPVEISRDELQLWANELTSSTSSPILVGDTVYVVTEKGNLCSIDAETGEIRWELHLGIEQRNSCPLYADGRLYVPILDDPAATGTAVGASGALYIIEPGETEGRIVSHIGLDGRCFGTPVAYNGKVYLQTTRKLYCFGRAGDNPGLPPKPEPERWPEPGPATQLQIIPYEVILHPGQTANFRARKLDANGLVVEEIKDLSAIQWEAYIPPTALVKARMDATFDAQGRLVAGKDAQLSAGRFEATLDGLKGYVRGRVIPYLPMSYDFESIPLTETSTTAREEPTAFAYPPLPWIGARFRFDVREKGDTQVLAKTIDDRLFQRGSVFIGTQEMSNYTIEADVLSDGARRRMSEVGLVNQRYIIVLKGNAQELEINSNLERLRVAVPFRWSPNVWHRLKARVDVAPDGTGVVRAKAWVRGEPEPDEWTIEVPHRRAHRSGSPGMFGFTPQEQRVYIDNIRVTAN
jgi:outer membrane protein assembly factor BamB